MFSVNWLVSANAIRGDSEISLAIFAGEERVSELYRKASGDDVFSIRVTIRGEVSVDHHIFGTTQNVVDKTVLSVEFQLKSGARVLRDASFRCDISRRSWGSVTSVATDVPVAVSADSTYQVLYFVVTFLLAHSSCAI